MAKSRQYEIKAPGIGFHTTKFGTLMLKYTPSNIIQLRDILAVAVQRLSEEALRIIEEERQEEIRKMTPPPTLEQKHENRVNIARSIPVAPRTGIAHRIIAQRNPPEKSDSPNIIVTSGFEGSDDGTLGPPPASIR